MNFWHHSLEPMSQLVNSIPGFQLTNLKFFVVAKTSKHFQKTWDLTLPCQNSLPAKLQVVAQHLMHSSKLTGYVAWNRDTFRHFGWCSCQYWSEHPYNVVRWNAMSKECESCPPMGDLERWPTCHSPSWRLGTLECTEDWSVHLTGSLEGNTWRYWDHW